MSARRGNDAAPCGGARLAARGEMADRTWRRPEQEVAARLLEARRTDAAGVCRLGMRRGFEPIGERGDCRAADRKWRRADSARGGCTRPLGLSRAKAARFAAGTRP